MAEKRTRRVNFEMPIGAFNRLVRLTERSESSSYTETVRNALLVYENFLNTNGTKTVPVPVPAKEEFRFNVDRD